MIEFVIKTFQEFPSYPGRDVRCIEEDKYIAKDFKYLETVVCNLERSANNNFKYNPHRWHTLECNGQVRSIYDAESLDDAVELLYNEFNVNKSGYVNNSKVIDPLF